MLHRIKILAVAAACVTYASSAFAFSAHHHSRVHVRDMESYPQLYEGRNAAMRWDFPTSELPNSRDFMVNEPGN
jgi:hypothetical protein